MPKERERRARQEEIHSPKAVWWMGGGIYCRWLSVRARYIQVVPQSAIPEVVVVMY